MIAWERVNNNDYKKIQKIVERAISYGYIDGRPVDRLSLTMDIHACHITNPLRLEDLLQADEFNFKHDVYGIVRHVDRETGKLGDCFSPRFSA